MSKRSRKSCTKMPWFMLVLAFFQTASKNGGPFASSQHLYRGGTLWHTGITGREWESPWSDGGTNSFFLFRKSLAFNAGKKERTRARSKRKNGRVRERKERKSGGKWNTRFPAYIPPSDVLYTTEPFPLYAKAGSPSGQTPLEDRVIYSRDKLTLLKVLPTSVLDLGSQLLRDGEKIGSRLTHTSHTLRMQCGPRPFSWVGSFVAPSCSRLLGWRNEAIYMYVVLEIYPLPFPPEESWLRGMKWNMAKGTPGERGGK